MEVATNSNPNSDVINKRRMYWSIVVAVLILTGIAFYDYAHASTEPQSSGMIATYTNRLYSEMDREIGDLVLENEGRMDLESFYNCRLDHKMQDFEHVLLKKLEAAFDDDDGSTLLHAGFG